MWHADYKTIQEEKETLEQSVQDYKKSQLQWLSFWDFKKQNKNTDGDKNLEAIVSLLEKDFYENSFQNTDKKYKSFSEFIEAKKQETEARKKSWSEQDMKQIVNTVLPAYSIYDIGYEKGEAYSELEFVNYVEKIMQTFNLEYEGDIGIEEVLPLEEESQKDPKKTEPTDEELLSNKIFYIPLKFSISGFKMSLVDFLYFIENVWRVQVVDWELQVYNDDFFKKDPTMFRKSDKLFEWDRATNNYNIYMNQFIDIESITFNEYVYKKFEDDNRNDFLANIRKLPQGLDKFDAEVVLRFYVKWVSDYQVEERYKSIVESIIAQKGQIDASLTKLSKLSIKQKTPEVAVLTKRLVNYNATIAWLEENLEKFKQLEAEKVYKDIFTSLEIEKLIEKDLENVSKVFWPIKVEETNTEEVNDEEEDIKTEQNQ